MGYGCKDEPPPRIAELERDGFNEGRVQFVELARVIIEGPTFHFNEANNGVEYHKIEALPLCARAWLHVCTFKQSSKFVFFVCLPLLRCNYVCLFLCAPIPCLGGLGCNHD